MIFLKSERERVVMWRAGQLVYKILQLLEESIEPGITTGELDRIANEAILEAGAYPAFKGYRGFPATICASVNQQVVHGIPGTRTLEDGDIISIDLGVILNGYYGDAARTFPVGSISSKAQELIQVTQEALFLGTSKCRRGNRLSDISHAIQTYVEEKGFSVVRDFVGHGIGTQMHESPQIPNFGPPGRGPYLQEGMVLALEPMVNIGGYGVHILKDGWTVETNDGSLSAHFEDMVFITRDGYQVLTVD